MRKLATRAGTVAGGMAAATAVGIAFAAWTTSGVGTGVATSRDSQDLVVAPGTTTGTLYPTGASDVAVQITNPNAYPVHVSSLELAPAGITASDASCNASSVTYTTQTNGGSGWHVAPGTTVSLNLAGAAAMSNSANDACKLNTFTVNLTANGASASAS